MAVLHINNADSNAQIGPNDASKFRAIVWVGLVVGLAASSIFHSLVKEENANSGHNVRGANLRLPVLDVLCSMQTYQVVFCNQAY